MRRKDQIKRFHQAGLSLPPMSFLEKLIHYDYRAAHPSQGESKREWILLGMYILSATICAGAVAMAAMIGSLFLWAWIADALVLAGVPIIIAGSSLILAIPTGAFVVVILSNLFKKQAYSQLVHDQHKHKQWDYKLRQQLEEMEPEQALECAEYLIKLERSHQQLNEAKFLLIQAGEQELIHVVQEKLEATRCAQDKVHQMLQA